MKKTMFINNKEVIKVDLKGGEKMPKRKRTAKAGKKSNIPVGVKIISVFYYIVGILCALFGLMIILSANTIISYLVSTTPELATLNSGALVTVGVIFGILLIGIGILSFFIGKGLWKLRKWARIVVIVFSILGVISAIYNMIVGFQIGQIVRLLVDGIIGGYLLFSEEVKRAFK